MFIHSLSSQLSVSWGLDTARHFGDSEGGWTEEVQTIPQVPDTPNPLNMR